MALGEIRCEERSNFWSFIYLGSFGASKKEKLAQNLAVTPSQYHTECWEESIWVGVCIFHVRT